MVALDDIDRRLLTELTRDGRVSMQVLAERVGVARATAYSRVERLQASGVIRGFRVDIDPAAIGRDLTALVLLNVRQDAWKSLPERLSSIDGVEWIGLTTASFDFVLLVRAEDAAHLRDVILGELQSIPEITSTQTILLLDELRIRDRLF